MHRKSFYILILIGITILGFQDINSKGSAFKIGRLKYDGGGDWYNDPSAEVNLLSFVAKATNIEVEAKYYPVDLSSNDIFDYPFVFMTGHGSVNLTEEQKTKLSEYLQAGGFLYIDDDYGMDSYIRPLLENLLPGSRPTAIPLTHPVYSSHFVFERGVPKIHEHDDKAPESLGLYVEDRLCLLYTFESNPSDGWADPDVHDNEPAKREAALKFGTNVIVYALTN